MVTIVDGSLESQITLLGLNVCPSRLRFIAVPTYVETQLFHEQLKNRQYPDDSISLAGQYSDRGSTLFPAFNGMHHKGRRRVCACHEKLATKQQKTAKSIQTSIWSQAKNLLNNSLWHWL